MEKRKNSFLLYGGLFLVAAIWGSGFTVTKIVLDSGIDPLGMVGIRFIGAFALLFTYFKIKKFKISKEEIKIGCLSGIFLFAAFAFQTIGLLYTTASKNAFITGANVIMIPFILWAITKKQPPRSVYFTSILCFAGIGVLSLENDFSVNYGDFLTLVCAFFFAVHMTFLGVKIGKLNPLAINCFQMLSAGILGILANYFMENGSLFSLDMSSYQMGAMGYIVLFNTLVCYLIQTAVQKYVDPSKVSLILATEMLFGGFFSILLLGDLMNFKMAIGGIFIFTSIIFAEMKEQKQEEILDI